MEQFRPRMKEGEDAEALLTSIQYYTLLRLHEIIPPRSYERLCLSIAGDFGDKVLSKEYNEHRPHQGRWCFGKTPMQTFLDALPLAKEKLMAA